ncbi:MAG: hypothetical protein A4E63_01017 [Syntrophorhabdus sp. PtaU1.Bin050]|nr:MAG: hypothetical protein A4E63_01017 [Syntrophorhabdus sp. PtaU1.Bin050]
MSELLHGYAKETCAYFGGRTSIEFVDDMTRRVCDERPLGGGRKAVCHAQTEENLRLDECKHKGITCHAVTDDLVV